MPQDIVNAVCCIYENHQIPNCSLDLYSKKPISNQDLLTFLKKNYLLSYVFNDRKNLPTTSGFKNNYFSLNKKLKDFGYKPLFSSLSGIETELKKILQ